MAKSIVASLSEPRHSRGHPSQFLVPPPAKMAPCLIIMGRVRPFVAPNRTEEGRRARRGEGRKEGRKVGRKVGRKMDAKSPLSVTTKRTLSIFSPRGAWCARALVRCCCASQVSFCVADFANSGDFKSMSVANPSIRNLLFFSNSIFWPQSADCGKYLVVN